MEKINLVEILKDCPKGMELDCVIYEDVVFHDVVDRYHPIRVRRKQGGLIYLNANGCINDKIDSKCVIFPKDKTTWEGFVPPCKFKDGDIIFTHADCLKVGLGNTWISIFQENRNGGCATYVDLAEDESIYCDYIDGSKGLLCMDGDILRQRLATEEEKQKLFDAIKENGYTWNAETKTLEKLVTPKFKVGDRITSKTLNSGINIITEVCENYYELDDGCTLDLDYQDCWELVPNKFDISTLEPFNKVLYRMRDGDTWCAGFYSFHKNNNHFIISNAIARQCIPYEENKHLLGTTNNCDEYYKTWKL